MKLSDMRVGQRGVITDLEGDSSLVQRLLELGLTDGETIEVVRFAPLGDPVEVRIRGYYLSLRKSEAAGVLVEVAP